MSDNTLYLAATIISGIINVEGWYRNHEMALEYIRSAIKKDPSLKDCFVILTVEQPPNQ